MQDLRKRLQEKRAAHKKLKEYNLLDEKDFLFSNEFNKYFVSGKMVMTLKHKHGCGWEEDEIDAIKEVCSQVSGLTLKASDDVNSGLTKIMDINSLTRYKNNIEGYLKNMIDLMPDYFELTGERETPPDYGKAMLCAKNALKIMREQIAEKKESAGL